MTQPEYEKKKRECFVHFCKDNRINQEVNISIFDAFNQIFDLAYTLGKQEQKKPKRMCLQDRSKVCNLCHECDIDPDAWYSMYNR